MFYIYIYINTQVLHGCKDISVTPVTAVNGLCYHELLHTHSFKYLHLWIPFLSCAQGCDVMPHFRLCHLLSHPPPKGLI